MAQSVVIEIGVDDQGTPVLKNVSNELDSLASKTGDAGDASEKMGAQNRQATGAATKMSPAMVAAGAAVAGIAVAAASAAAGVAILVSGIRSSIESFREQDEANRVLERSLRRTGAAGGPLRAQIDAIGDSINQLAVDTNFGDEELAKMAATFIDMSGRATATAQDLSLIADISAGMGTSGEAAARLYANALEGQLRPTMARTTALTEEQIVAINEATDSTERARLAQEALSAAYGGTASDINPLFRATKNLEDAKADLAQAIGQVFAEGGALEPVIDLVTGALRRMESWVQDNSVAIQEFVIDGVIFAVEGLSSLIQTMQQMAPVIAGVIEGVQHTVRNFQIFVSMINVVIRSAVAFTRAVQSGIINVLGRVLEAAMAVSEFLGRDIPQSVRDARDSLNDIGDSLEEDMIKHLDAAGESVENITAKLIENSNFVENVADGSARIADGLGRADDVAGNLLETLRKNRAAIKAISDEEDQEGSARGPSRDAAEEEIEEEIDKNAELARLEREQRDLIAQIRMAAITEEDERHSIMLEHAARRHELELRDLSDAERKLEMMRLEMQLERDLGAVYEEEMRERTRLDEEQAERDRKRLEAIQSEAQAREQLLQQTLRGFDAQLSGAGTLAASIRELSEAEWDFEEATSATLAAFQGLADMGGQFANAVTEDKEKAAKIEAAFNAAAAIGAGAAFAATGFTVAPLGIAAAQHGIAAAQFAAIGGGAASGGGASAGARSGGGRSAREAQTIEVESSQDSRPIVFNNNFNGTFMEDSNAIDRKISNASQRAAQNRFVAGRGRGR